MKSGYLNISLDTQTMNVTREGVLPFRWPIRREERVEAGQFVVETLVTTLREAQCRGDQNAEAVLILSSHLIVEATAIFQAQLLAHRFHRAKTRAEVPDVSDLWRAAFENRAPRRSPFLEALASGLRGRPHWRRFARPLRGLMMPPGLKPRPIEWIDFAAEIVTVTVCPLTTLRAAAEARGVVVCPLYEWFPPPEAGELPNDIRRCEGSTLIPLLVDALAEGFAARDCPLAEPFREYLLAWLSEGVGWIRFYLRQLQGKPQRLPKDLWIGTGGIIWSRLLARSVRACGGRVTSHDHAYGATFSLGSVLPFVDLQDCDRYVTFSQFIAEELRKRANHILVNGNCPELVVPRPNGMTVLPIDAPNLAEVREVRTVMHVTPMYPTVIGEVLPLMADIVAVDWQARLFAHLSGRGYSVVQKPHPASRVPVPSAFASLFGVEELGGRFEDVYSRADLLIIDYPLTTVFGVALRSEKPVVFIDFGLAEWPPHAKKLLGRRCAVVRGWFDEENRAQIDWDELRDAIERAPHLRDYGFVNTVLGGELNLRIVH